MKEFEESEGGGVVSCKEMGEAPVRGVGQALRDKDIRAKRGEREGGDSGGEDSRE